MRNAHRKFARVPIRTAAASAIGRLTLLCGFSAVVLALLTFPNNAQAQGDAIRPISTVTQGFKSKYNTIAHEILNIESAASLVTQDMYDFIDDVIDQAKKKIPTKQKYSPDEIGAALKAIDDILIQKNVVYPANDAGMKLVDQLSDGLRGRIMNSAEISALAKQRHNVRRAEHIKAHAGEPFYVNDCDTTSFLYLAVGEVLGFPLFLVEVPGHNFIRYEDEVMALDWETMDAKPILPGLYQKTWRIPDSLVASRVYLASMSRIDTLGYAHTIVAEAWSKKGADRRAFDDDERGFLLYPRGPRVWNQAAWHLVTASSPALRDGQKALHYALRAIGISPTPNYLDTLACAYAALGDFSSAIQTEQAAQVLFQSGQFPAEVEIPEFSKQIELFQKKQSCAPPSPVPQKNFLAHTTALIPQ